MPNSADKLSPHSLRCIFVGYPTTKKGYRFYHPPTIKFLVSLDVTFHEWEPYFAASPSPDDWVLNRPLPEVTFVPLLCPTGTRILVPTILSDDTRMVTLDSAAATEAPSGDIDASSHGGGGVVCCHLVRLQGGGGGTDEDVAANQHVVEEWADPIALHKGKWKCTLTPR